MKGMMARTPLKDLGRKLTNHSARKTSVRKMKSSGCCYAIAHNKLFVDEEPTPLVTFKHDEADTLLIWYSMHCKLRFGDNIYTYTSSNIQT